MAESRSSSWDMPSVGIRAAAPLREQTANALRSAILSLSLTEGERLVERELIEHLGVSRTTVREALRELESEGLVEVIPQRGAVVATVSERDATDLYAAQMAIEELIIRRFVESADDATVTELTKAVDHFAAIANEADDVGEMLVAKNAVYEILGRGAGSPPLWRLLSGLQARLQVLRARSLSQPGRPAASARELKELAAAITARDADAACALCSERLQMAAATGLASPRPVGITAAPQ